jgi:hypothetical protein
VSLQANGEPISRAAARRLAEPCRPSRAAIDVRDYLRATIDAARPLPGLRARIKCAPPLECHASLIGRRRGRGGDRLPSRPSVSACTLHRRTARQFATGIKLARPDLKVVVLTGDGDGLAIGGNHLIHAARRNIDLTFLLFNNAIYGMTGGQLAPTTPEGAVASTAPFGNVEPAFDACELMAAAGATFVARVVAYEAPKLVDDRGGAPPRGRCSWRRRRYPVCYGRQQPGRGPEMLAGMKRTDAAIDGCSPASASYRRSPLARPLARRPGSSTAPGWSTLRRRSAGER